MSYLHRCALCGWNASSRSLTIVEPYCPACGGLLGSSAAAPAEEHAERHDFALPLPVRWVPALLRVALLGAALYVFVPLGYEAGGVALATVAFGLTNLALVQLLVPETR